MERDETAGAEDDRLTGEILTQLYVTDVLKSVAFYEALGFERYYYYDYETSEYTRQWNKSKPPLYAEVTRGSIRISFTTHDEDMAQTFGGGVRHYFIVNDVRAHFARVKQNGITAEPDEVEVRPWMDFFTVSDPDGHQIVFGQKHQAYYDRTREHLERLRKASD